MAARQATEVRFEFHFDISVMIPGQNGIGSPFDQTPIGLPPLGSSACFFVTRNGRERDTVFESSPVGGIIVGGNIFVCAIEHTCLCTRSQ
jgi:hypothetical protein